MCRSSGNPAPKNPKPQQRCTPKRKKCIAAILIPLIVVLVCLGVLLVLSQLLYKSVESSGTALTLAASCVFQEPADGAARIQGSVEATFALALGRACQMKGLSGNVLDSAGHVVGQFSTAGAFDFDGDLQTVLAIAFDVDLSGGDAQVALYNALSSGSRVVLTLEATSVKFTQLGFIPSIIRTVSAFNLLKPTLALDAPFF